MALSFENSSEKGWIIRLSIPSFLKIASFSFKVSINLIFLSLFKIILGCGKKVKRFARSFFCLASFTKAFIIFWCPM